MKKILSLIFLAVSILGCDTIDEPLKDDYGFVDLPQTNKTVLIEEFTGTSCTFCPDGARKIQGYIRASPKNVVTVAIHASGFAIPNPKHPYDFRTAEGQDFYEFMGSGGLPGGMFDRVGFPDDVFKHPAEWDQLLQQRLSELARLSLSATLEYDTAANEFKLNAGALALTDIEGEPLNITAYLVEDSIVAPQLDNNVTIKDYVHNHVFRSSFSGMTGEQISSGSVTKDQIFTKDYTLPVKPEWKVKNCSAVIFVYNPTTQEVLQAHHESIH